MILLETFWRSGRLYIFSQWSWGMICWADDVSYACALLGRIAELAGLQRSSYSHWETKDSRFIVHQSQATTGSLIFILSTQHYRLNKARSSWSNLCDNSIITKEIKLTSKRLNRTRRLKLLIKVFSPYTGMLSALRIYIWPRLQRLLYSICGKWLEEGL